MKRAVHFRIISLFIVLILTTFNNSFSQDTLSLPAVQFGSMVSTGQYLYMFGGIADQVISDNVLKKIKSLQSAFLNDLSAGDPEQNKWAKEDPKDGVKPEGRTYQKAVYDNNSKSIYVYGGTTGGPILTDLWKYEIEKKTWTKIQQSGTTPPARLLPSVSPTNDGLIVVGGKGSQGEYVADCWYYNYLSNSWTQKANPPADVEFDGHKSVNVSENTIALWGGDNNTKVNEVWTYNINSNAWTKNTTSGTGPQNKRGGFVMEKIGNKAYVGGGTENFTTKVSDFYSLDLSTWEWTKLTDIPAKLFAASSSVLYDKLYVYGGNDENSKRSNKMYEYNPTTNQWTEKIPTRVYPPKAPSNVTVELNSQKKIVVKWKNNSTVADKVVISRQVDGGNWWPVGMVGPNDTEFIDEYDGKGTLKYYVWADNIAGYSNSEEVTINVTGVATEANLALEYKLFQNYPNPFNPETNIEFALSSSEKVTLKIFDLLGREVATIIQKELTAGRHKVIFDGSKLTSGIYFYKIIAGKYSDTKKLLLLR